MAKITRKQLLKALSSYLTFTDVGGGKYRAEIELPPGLTLGGIKTVMLDQAAWDAATAGEKADNLRAALILTWVVLLQETQE